MSRISMFNVWILFICIYLSCENPISKENREELTATKSFQLTKSLEEISGLAFDIDSNIIAINDEEGIIFTLNPEDGRIIHETKFKKEGDFEGIAQINGLVYALESDGDIFEVDQKGERKKYDLFEDKDYEFEGLCPYGKESLLIACKHHKKKELDKDYVWVFQFNLEKKQRLEKAFLKLKRTEDLKHFRPSAINYNSHNGELYLLSGASRQLLILDQEQNIKKIYQLNYFDFPQAEGLLVDNSGGFFIATERNTFEFAKLLYIEI